MSTKPIPNLHDARFPHSALVETLEDIFCVALMVAPFIMWGLY